MCANEKTQLLRLAKKISKAMTPWAGFIVSAACIASASAASYRLTNLSAVLPANTVGALSLNNAGHIMGHAADPQLPAPNQYTYIYKDGGVTRLASPPSTYTEGVSFNDQDDMTGNLYQYAQDGVTVTARRIFLYRDGQLTDITNALPASQSGTNIQAINNVDQLIGYFSGHEVDSYIYDSNSQQVTNIPGLNNITTGRAINNIGQVTGQAFTGFGTNNAFLYSNGATSDLGSFAPRGSSQDLSDGVSINDATQITGTTLVGGIQHGFIYQNGQMQDIGSLGGASAAFKINNSGSIVGSSQLSISSTATHAFIYTSSMVDLNTLIDPTDPLASSVVLTSATDINDSGQILASGTLASGQTATFLLAPDAAVDNAYYNFEQSTHNWYNDGDDIVSFGLSTAQKFAGASSLAVQFNGAGFVSMGAMYPPLLAGKTITFHIYIPADATLDWIQPFALEDYPNWTWHGNWQPLSNLRLGAWNTLTVDVPADAQPIYRLGVEFSASQPYGGTVFIDSIGF